MEHNEKLLEEINQDELPFKSWLALAWALFWRGLIIMLGAMLSSGLIGGVLGFIAGLICGIIKIPL